MARVSQGATLRDQKCEAAAGALCWRGGGISPAGLLAGVGVATPSGRLCQTPLPPHTLEALGSFHPEKPQVQKREVRSTVVHSISPTSTSYPVHWLPSTSSGGDLAFPSLSFRPIHCGPRRADVVCVRRPCPPPLTPPPTVTRPTFCGAFCCRWIGRFTPATAGRKR